MNSWTKSTSHEHPESSSPSGAGSNPEILSVAEERNAGVKRVLKSRHLQMIAIGGIVGPGLLVGSGGALAVGGPAAVLIVFALVGFLALLVMQSVGELSTLYPQGGSFTTWSGRFVDDALSLVVGYNYVLIWVTVLANEYNVVSLLLQYWTSKVPPYAWILILWFVFGLFALLGVAAYGEAEFWLATIKVIGLLMFFIVAICIDVGAIGNQGYLGFRLFVKPGAFSDGFSGCATAFSYVATYYAGVEAIGTTAGECQNPRRAIPVAIKQVFVRIILIYMGTIFFYSLTVPWNSPTLISATSKAAAAPMTMALVNAGWNGAGNLINAFILVSVISAINSSIYMSSRTVLFLASEGKAPRFLAKTSSKGVPVNAIILSNSLGLLALLNTVRAAGKVYFALVNLSSVSTFIVWGIINFTHLRHMAAWKAHGRDRAELPYRSWWQPYQAYTGLALNIIFVLIQGYSSFRPFDAGNFIIAYILLPISLLGFFGWKVLKSTTWRSIHNMDLQSGQLEEQTKVDSDRSIRKPWIKKVWSVIVGNDA